MSDSNPTDQEPKPKRKPGPPGKLGTRRVKSTFVPGYLPPEIASQPALAQRAFVLLCTKPGRSMRSIAKELATSPSTLAGLSRAGRWDIHLAHFLQQGTESLLDLAKEEAQRSRAHQLQANRLSEAAIDAALKDLVEFDDHGNPRLKPGATVQDVQRLQSARHTMVKTTMLLTGEDQAGRVAAAKAGATKIVLGSVEPVPVTVEAQVIASAVPGEEKSC